MKEFSTKRKSQVRIEFADLDEGKIIVEKILLTAADRFKLYDNSHTSRVPDTIKSIVEGDGVGFGLGARVVENTICVDFLPNNSDSLKFDGVREFILDELRKAFRLELKEISEGNPSFVKIH